MANEQVSVPFSNYCNYIQVEPPRHADHKAVFVHVGNRLTVVGADEHEFKTMIKTHPDFTKKLVTVAQEIITEAKRLIK